MCLKIARLVLAINLAFYFNQILLISKFEEINNNNIKIKTCLFLFFWWARDFRKIMKGCKSIIITTINKTQTQFSEIYNKLCNLLKNSQKLFSFRKFFFFFFRICQRNYVTIAALLLPFRNWWLFPSST